VSFGLWRYEQTYQFTIGDLGGSRHDIEIDRHPTHFVSLRVPSGAVAGVRATQRATVLARAEPSVASVGWENLKRDIFSEIGSPPGSPVIRLWIDAPEQ
jgi:hypothetical protein